MNWGKYIILTLIAFAIFMMYFLIRVLMYGGEEVPKNYFDKDNELEQHAKGMSEVKKLAHRPIMGFDSIGNFNLEMHENHFDSIIIQISAPGSKNTFFEWKQKKYSSTLNIPDKGESKGFRNITIAWWDQGKYYYDEERLYKP